MGRCFCVSPSNTAFLVGGVCFLALAAMLVNTPFMPIGILTGLLGAGMLAEAIFSKDDK